MTTESRTIEIVAKVKDFATSALRKFSTTLQAWSKRATTQLVALSKSVLSLRTAFGLLVGGFAAFRGGRAVVGILDSAEQMTRLAEATNTSVEQLSVLQQAFDFAGIDAKKFGGVTTQLSRAVGTALNDGTSKAAIQFNRLGISLETLRKSGPIELFSEIAGALEQIATPQQRLAALAELFPKAADSLEDFVAVLGQGRNAFRAFLDATEYFGGALSEQAASATGRLKTAIDALGLSLGKVSRAATVAIAEKLAPIFERFATWFALNGERIGKAIGAIVAALVELTLKVAEAFVRLVGFLSSNGEKIVEWLEEIPFIGATAAKAMRELFDTREIVPKARKFRDELADLAEQEQKLLRVQEDLQRAIAIEKGSGDDPSVARLAQLNSDLEAAAAQRQDIFFRMSAAEAEFYNAQKRGGGQAFPLEMQRQRAGAEIRASADDLFSRDQVDGMPAPFRELAEALKEAMRGLTALGEEAEDTSKKVKGAFEEFSDGFAAQFAEIRKQWSDFGAAGREAATSIISGGLDGLTDAFADIVTGQKSAKEAFKDLARTMLGELARIIAKLAIMRAMQGFGLGLPPGLETGGVMPGNVQSTVPLQKFANGGVVKRPTLALFGEGKASRGEAFVPLPDGRRIPVALTGGGGGGGGVMNITIQAMDGADVQRVLVGNRGTLRALWSHDISRVQAVRQTVKGAVQ